jgi:hypothetical protein
MTADPWSSGRFRDWHEANPGAQQYGTGSHPTTLPPRRADTANWGEGSQVPREPRRPRPRPRPGPRQAPATGGHPTPYQTPYQTPYPTPYPHDSPGAYRATEYGHPTTVDLEGVTDYRDVTPYPTYQHWAIPRVDPWDEPAGGRRREPVDSPDPWPTRVSGSSAMAAVALVVLIGTVGAVGLPRLMGTGGDEHALEAVTLTQPAEAAGLPRLPDAEVTAEDRRAAEQLLSAVRTPLTTEAAVYTGESGVRLTVITGRPATALTDRELETLRTGFSIGMEAARAPVRQLDTGLLGGWFGCGQTEHGVTLCLAMDAGAIVSITVTEKGSSAIVLAQAARQDVEHVAP